MHINFGLREKLLLPLVLGLTVIVCVLFFVWQPYQLNKWKMDYIKDQTNILKTLSPSLIQNMLSNDLAAVHSILNHSLQIHKKNWRYIQLKNPAGKLLYPIFKNPPEMTETTIKISTEIKEENEIFGSLILHTDWQQEKAEQIEFNNLLAQLSIFLFIIIGAFSLFIQTQWIYKPITRLKDITSRFSNGDYDSQLPAITQDEIGLLTKSIDHMRHKIQSTLDELTNKEKMTRSILETAPDAIITMNKDGIINSFNPGAEKLFQYSAKEIIGKNVTRLMPDELSKHHDKYVSDFNTSTSTTIGKNRELKGMRKDGTLFPIEITINVNLIEGEHLFTGVLRDITERKKIEKLKSDFIATVSHELRTPLTAIKGSMDIITKGLDLDLPEKAQSMLDVTNRNVERLLTLINDILDISKLESGEINFFIEPIEIIPFLEHAIEINQEYAAKFNTSFKCTQNNHDVIVQVDKNRLMQVMSNLLSNAAKYSRANIPVEIFTSINNESVSVNIKNYGAGIPEEFQDRLFEKFTQSDSGDTRQVGGTGLGLSISKMIIENLGGTIGFSTIKNQETTFYFKLPIASKS